MNIIKSRHIWILIVLMTAFISPVRGQTSAGSNIVSRTVLSGGGVAEQRVYDNGLGDVIQEVQSWPSTSLQDIVVHPVIKNRPHDHNSKEKTFTDAPQKVNELLNREDVQNAIKKGQKYLGE